MMLEKYRGDYHYMRNDSAKALEHYERCLNLAPKSATSVQRDCVDGMARCHLNLGRSGEALKCTETLELDKDSDTVNKAESDEEAESLSLLVRLYEKLHQL
ncbi:hypothetical protein HPB48_005256 [Haemaphysalis longicornis]|uniref:Tetratricopeptide repeat protein n=1 Tax=Haemaphysalis longicornis TaxID=44386 RepID=A0A9J6FLR7_HAELO|nr:hypothetical protein HPB48_005256 [Haemaphysalis longicornis]